jgi:iron(III) transport system ATP-binding protein
MNVKISGLHKGFGANHPVLRGVGLEVPQGTFTAVLGPSGSGKTTLLRAVAGFGRPEAGHDRDRRPGRGRARHLRAAEPARDRLRAAGGQPLPAPGRRGQHRLRAAARAAQGAGRRTARADRPVRPRHRYPHQLSGGQQQRVALVRALAPEPALVLLDEPFSSLDAGLRASVRADVRGILRDFDMTAILVTHDQDEALSMADQVVVLRDGVVVQQAAPQDLYDNPADQSLARFVGDANLVVGVLAGEKVRSVLGTLPTRAVDGLDDGARVTALIRPEQIKVLPEGDGDFAGCVASCEYFGHDTLLSITPDDAGAEPLIVRTGFEGSLPVGTRVSLAVSGAVTVWPAV